MSESSSSSLKQRLIGAIVVVSLAVIFLPMIFDKPQRKPEIPLVEVPAAPPPQNYVIEEPRAPEVVVDGAHGERLNRLKDKAVIPGNTDEQKKKRHREAVVEVIEEQPRPVKTNVIPVKKTEQPRLAKRQDDRAKANDFSGKWLVQLGSFSVEANAEKLAAQVSNRGFQAHILGSGEKLQRVLVGPFATREKAESAQRQLSALIKAKTLVVAF